MVIGLIPARGGSKGIANKNLVPIAGKPLIDYTLMAASLATGLDRIILTTDSETIAEHGRRFGIEIPGLRPPELADDDTPMEAVMKHVIDEDATIDAESLIVLLQPTSPLRSATDIDNVIELHDSNVDTVVSVCRLHHSQHPESVLRRQGKYLVPLVSGSTAPQRRQSAEVLFARNGPAVVATRSGFLARGVIYGDRILGYEMPPQRSVDINTRDDLHLAEALIQYSSSVQG